MKEICNVNFEIIKYTVWFVFSCLIIFVYTINICVLQKKIRALRVNIFHVFHTILFLINVFFRFSKENISQPICISLLPSYRKTHLY